MVMRYSPSIQSTVPSDYLCSLPMPLRQALPASLRELRLLGCQHSTASQGLRSVSLHPLPLPPSAPRPRPLTRPDSTLITRPGSQRIPQTATASSRLQTRICPCSSARLRARRHAPSLASVSPKSTSPSAPLCNSTDAHFARRQSEGSRRVSCSMVSQPQRRSRTRSRRWSSRGRPPSRLSRL